MKKLKQKAYSLLQKISKGKVTTYKILAEVAGKPKNWRQIGKILSQNPYSQNYADDTQTNADSRRKSALGQRQSAICVPCYKVVKSNGEIGGYNCGKIAKKKALQKDGIIVLNNKIKDFKKHLFNNFPALGGSASG